MAITVYIVSSAVQVITCVYLPFYKAGDHKQTDLFVETIDALQSIIDKFNPRSICPIRIIGDLNVQLPQHPQYREIFGIAAADLTANSIIMMDFIAANDLVVSDFSFKQHVSYMPKYLCDANRAYTWIDHCLSSANSQTQNCKIIPCDPCNVSDHLPLSMSIEIVCSQHHVFPGIT